MRLSEKSVLDSLMKLYFLCVAENKGIDTYSCIKSTGINRTSLFKPEGIGAQCP